MNKHIRKTLPCARRAALASTFALLFGSTALLAQTGSSTSSTRTDDTTTTRPNSANQPSGTGYQSTTGAAADVDATRDINTRNAANQPTGDDMKLGWGDRRFVTKAADSGMTELQLAQLAAQRASNPEVKAYAQKLVEDHSKVNTELTALAGQKNVKLDTDDDPSRAYKRLSEKSGAEFDQEFVAHMVDEHEKDVKMFEKASTDAKDSEIRSFASRHVEHLREHLQTAQNLQATVMPTGRVDDYSGRSTTGGATSSGLGTSTTDSPSTSDPRTTTDTDRTSTGTDTSTATPRPDGSR